jgi:hypothetical protein
MSGFMAGRKLLFIEIAAADTEAVHSESSFGLGLLLKGKLNGNQDI